MDKPTKSVYWKPFGLHNENEPTYRRRCKFVIDELRNLGWQVGVPDHQADIVVLQRIFNVAEIRQHQDAGRLTIAETNDCYLFPDTVFYKPDEEESIRTADYVVVTCRWMQKRYGRINPRTVAIQEALEPEFWAPREFDLKDSPLILSWHGMPDNLQYVEPIVEAFPRKGIVLRFVMPLKDSKGNSNADRVKRLPVKTQFVEWKRETFVREIARAHGGIVPLPDTEFCRCKAHHKAVGYQALGMPVIASNMPGYREVIRHGETGLLADTPEQWAECVERLKDPGERQRMGEAGRELSQWFTPPAIGKVWSRLLHQIAS